MREFQSLIIRLILVMLVFSGCGGGGGSSTSAAGGGGGAAEAEAQPATSTIRLESVLERRIPADVTHVRLTGYDLDGQVRYGPVTRVKAPVIIFTEVPLSVRRVQVELLRDDIVVALALQDVILTPGEVTPLVNLDFQDVEAKLLNLSLEPGSLSLPLGTSGRMRAVGHYQGDTVLDLSNSVVWSVSGNGISVSPSGEIEARSRGEFSVTATYQSFSAQGSVRVTDATLVSLQLSPSQATIAKGLQQTFVLEGTYSDNSVLDLTGEASFASSNETVADAIVQDNVFSGLAQGQVTITADYGGQQATSVLSVSPAELQQLTISPTTLAMPKGTSRQLDVMGLLTDGTPVEINEDAVTWTTLDPDVCSVTPEGLIHAVAVGETFVKAESGAISKQISVSVGAPEIKELVVTPQEFSVTVGEERQLRVDAIYTDNASEEVTNVATFTSLSPSVASVTTLAPRGLVQGVGVGSATIEVGFSGFQIQAGVTVEPVPVGDLEVRFYNILSRQVDDVISRYEFTLLEAPEGVVSTRGPESFVRTFDQPVQSILWTGIEAGDHIVEIKFFDSGETLRGTFRQQITIVGGETTLIDNPSWQDTPLDPPDPVETSDPKKIVHKTLSGTPRALVYDADRERVYLTNSTNGTVEIYNPVTEEFLAPIIVGSAPWGLDLSPDNNKLIVCLSGASRLAVLDLTQNPVEISYVDVPGTSVNRPRNIAVAANGKALFGAVFPGSGWTPLYELDLATMKVIRRNDLVDDQTVRDPLYLGANLDRSRLLLAEGNSSAGEWFFYDSATNTMERRRSSSGSMTRAAVSPDGAEGAVTSGFFNRQRQKIAGVQANGAHFCYSPAPKRGYYGGTTLQLVNLDRYLVEETISLPATITGPMTTDETGRRVFALAGNSLLDVSLGANRPPSLVSLKPFVVPVGESASIILKAQDGDGDPVRIEAVQLPNGASYDPDEKLLTYRPTASTSANVKAHFVVSDGISQSSGSIELAASPQDTPVKFLPTGGVPAELKLDSLGEILYITNRASNQVERLATELDDLLRPFNVGPAPRGFDITPDGASLLLCNQASEFLQRIYLATEDSDFYYVERPDSAYENPFPYDVVVSQFDKALISVESSGSSFENPRILNLLTGVTTIKTSPSLSEPSPISASSDRSKIVICEGNISGPDFYKYNPQTDGFTKLFEISGFIRDLVLEGSGERMAVLPGPILFTPAGVRLATGSGHEHFAFIDSNLGVAHSKGAAVRLLNLTTLTISDTIPLPQAATGPMTVSSDGETVYVICDGGVAVVDISEFLP